MARQTLIWTALPYGVNGTKLQLSAILSPRLYSDTPLTNLGEFPDFLNWPAVPLTFQVQFSKGPILMAQRVSAPPDLALWRRLFTAATAVMTYDAADESETTVLSYPAVNVTGFVHEQYRKIALAYPTRLPPAATVMDREHFGVLSVANGQLTQQLKQVRAEIAAEQSRVATIMRQAYLQKVAAEQPRTNPPILPPIDSTPADSGIPTGLREHIEAVIKQNQQQAADRIGSGLLDRAGVVRESAEMPDNRPAYRPGEVPGDLPITWPIDQAPNPLRDFLRADLFHKGTSPLVSGGISSRAALPIPMIPKIDFHRALSVLSSYPMLLRRLGIVVDLEVDLQGVGQGAIPPNSLVRVLPSFAASVPTAHARTWSAYQFGGGQFLPAPRPSSPEVSHGLLNVSDPNGFALIQTDPDSAAASVLSLVNGGLDTTKPEAAVALPVLRSCGLALARSGADILLVQSFVMNSLNNRRLAENRDDIVFYAEDLAMGYRPDIYVVRGSGSHWFSLTGRIGTYATADGGFSMEHQDEGWIGFGATRASSGTVSNLLLHQMMFAWQGWSLAVPPLEPGDRPDSSPDLLTDLRMRTTFRVPPGSLPMLRYGQAYHVRARMVDLAGNSLPFTDTVGPSAIPQASQTPFVYRRMEPLTSPQILLRAQPTDTTTATRLFVRTLEVPAQNGSPAAQQQDVNVRDSQRLIAPPSVAVKQAEIHGMFDTETGMDRYRYQDAVDHRRGRFGTVVTDPQPALPYLPDPFARHAAFQFLPGTTREVFTVPFTDADAPWPDFKPFRLELVPAADATSPPQVTWDTTVPGVRVLKVRLPQGAQAKVPLGCAFESTDPAAGAGTQGLANLQNMFIWSLLDPTDQSAQQADALQGRLWLLSQSRELLLTHAVQKPVTPPLITEATVTRKLGETAGLVSARIAVHGPSTGDVQMNATWERIDDDPRFDDPAQPGPRVVPAEGHGLADSADFDATELDLYGRQEFGDTRHKQVAYTALGFTRYKDYFPDVENTVENFSSPADFDGPGLKFVLDVPATAPPPAPRIAYAIPVFSFQPNVAGQLFTLSDGDVRQLTPAPIKEYSETVTSPDRFITYVRDVDYTIDYAAGRITWTGADSTPVMIGFGAIRTEGASRLVSIRKGGVRIYLERPWFESGAGELLGVIIPERLGSRVRPGKSLRAWVSHWGRDPIWKSGETHRHPRPEHFPLATAVQTQVKLQEAGMSGTTVTVVGHPVAFDWEQKLWYCDIAIDAGPAYFPFLKLSLVRYQPSALEGAHVSTVTLADFIQLAPDRATTVVRGVGQVQVTVTGETYAQGKAGPALVEASVEQATDAAGATLLWERLTEEPVMLERRSGYWTGVVPLPANEPGKRLRLAVAEYEQLPADAADRLVEGSSYTRRVVFADILDL